MPPVTVLSSVISDRHYIIIPWSFVKDSRTFVVARLLQSERAFNVVSALHRTSSDSQLSGWPLHT